MAKKILLADDSVTIQKVVELTFMDEDYEVVATSDGSSALERLPEVAPDLVIADVHMPQTDGYEVCRQTKQNHPGIPVLLLVGTFEQFDQDKATAVGADGHLKKPFDSQDLLTQVEELIAGAGGASAASEVAVDPVASDEPAVDELEPPMLMDEVAAPVSAGSDTRPTERRSFDDPIEDVAEVAASEVTTPEVAAAEVTEPEASAFELEDVAEEAVAPVVEVVESASPASIFETTPGDFKVPDFASGAAYEEPTSEVEPAAEVEAFAEVADDDAADTDVMEVPPMELVADSPAAESLFEAAASVGDSDEPPLAEAADLEAPTLESSSLADAEPEPIVEPVAAAAVATPEPEAVSEVAEVAEVVANDVAASNGSRSLSDDDIDRIAKRVAEIMGEKALREVAWEVIPDLAEVIIKERIRELESQVE